MTTSTKKQTLRNDLAPLLTIDDLEQLFRVHRRTIARWWKKGQIPPPLKLGGSNRWKGEEIARVLDRQGE